MGKLIFKTQQEADDALQATKDELAVAKDEFKTWRVEKKLKGDVVPEDPKLAKTWEKMNGLVEKKRAAIAEIKEWKGANKVKKERPVKYEYPANATSAEKKKIRASERAAVKRAAKEAAGGGKTSTKKKKEEKVIAPAEGPKMSKQERKALKKAEGKKETAKED